MKFKVHMLGSLVFYVETFPCTVGRTIVVQKPWNILDVPGSFSLAFHEALPGFQKPQTDT